ncbi:hypothetical protein SAMN05444355_101521 [Flavobacterium frigoris]|uniref:Uncharacterized protein n=1 Tax=Flavobacterium frigoris TaxID=229204 RepID=A0A1H9DLU3_FLAFI|nr:hypothetical protein SAMN05444355_101521 [Flavobacterium frigoris]
MLIKTQLVFEVKVKDLMGKYKNLFQFSVFWMQIKSKFFNYKVVVLNYIRKKVRIRRVEVMPSR